MFAEEFDDYGLDVFYQPPLGCFVRACDDVKNQGDLKRYAAILVLVNRRRFVLKRVLVFALDDRITKSRAFEVGAQLLRRSRGEEKKLAAARAVRGARKQHRIDDADDLGRAEDVELVEDG